MDNSLKRVSVAAAGLPGRYAAALFDLAETRKSLEPVAADLATLGAALEVSADLRALIGAPQVRRDAAGRAVAALAAELGLGDLVTRFLGVLAANGRLAALPAIIRAYTRMLAAWKGTDTALVTTAHKLTAAQKKALETRLKARTGRQMALEVTVDPAILGGLVVRIGSEQIDSSIRTRLQRLAQHMKG